jgi:hypothetical protein
LENYFHLIIRLSKSDSVFVYFQLEANEGLAFYSTLAHVEGQETRDIDIRGSVESYNEVKRLIDFLAQSMTIQTIKDEPSMSRFKQGCHS